MSNARKEWVGIAPQTTLASTFSASTPAAGATFTVTSGTGYPTGAYTGGFVIVLDRGTAAEEKVLCSARSGNTFTVGTSGRAWDGTTASAHGGGVTNGTVEHCVDADTLTDLSGHVYDTTRDDHTQYQKKSLLTTAGDIIYASATSVWARLAKGTAYQALGMNSGASAPAWMASLQSLMTAAGDTVYASGANTPARLAKGSDGTVYTLASGVPSWASPAAPANDAAYVATNETTSSSSFTDLSTAGPAVTVITGTKALVIVSAKLDNDTINGAAVMGFAVSSATTLAADISRALRNSNIAGVEPNQISYSYIVTGLTAGSNVFTAKYEAAGGGTASFADRRISVVNMGS